MVCQMVFRFKFYKIGDRIVSRVSVYMVDLVSWAAFSMKHFPCTDMLELYFAVFFNFRVKEFCRRFLSFQKWARQDSNLRTPMRTALEAVAVGHLATNPIRCLPG